MTLWIITVNFGNTEATKLLIDSLSTMDNLDFIKVGIADNEASEKSTSKLEEINKSTKLDITISSYKKNHYYWPAAKKTIDNLKNKFGFYPDWVIICNNDIIFNDKSFFLKLSKINVRKHPIIGPNIITPHGQALNPFMKTPLTNLEKLYWDIYFLSFHLSVVMLKIKKMLRKCIKKSNSENLTTNQKVYAVHGSTILFSNYFFEVGGWIDDNFEMYGEELTVAEIAKTLKIPVTFIPQLKILHDEHSSTKNIDSQVLFSKAKQSHKYFKSVYLK